MPVHVLDTYYLGLTAIITVVYQLAFFAVAFTLSFDKLTDLAGGTNFIVLAVVTLVLGSRGSLPDADAVTVSLPPTRQIVASVLLAVWALRLAAFLFVRILRTGHDSRFDGTRDRFFPFLGFWVAQMVWVWTVSLPVTVINSPAVQELEPGLGHVADAASPPAFGTARDVTGLVLFAIGFPCEAIADLQRFRFAAATRRAPAVAGPNARLRFCSSGLFAWSRHPNYFGDILLHFGIFTIASSDAQGSAAAAVNASIVGPVLLTLLLFFVSGMSLSERPAAAKRYAAACAADAADAADADTAREARELWAAYSAYLHRTSILVPLPPALYAPLPVWIKRTLLLEWPLYVFDPAKHGTDTAPSKTQPSPPASSSSPC